MRYQKRIYLLCLLFLAALYFIPAENASGARVSGDTKVTPSAPETDSSVTAPSPEVKTSPDDNQINDPAVIAPPPGEIAGSAGIDLPPNQNPAAEDDVINSPSPEDPTSREMTGPAVATPAAKENSTVNRDISQAPAAAGSRRSTAKNSATATGTIKPSKTQGGKVAIDIFNDMDITFFIKWIAEETGRNFVVDSNVKGKVTIISPRSLTIDEAYKVFESVLEVNGYTTVPSGNVIKIVPMTEARSKSIETNVDFSNPDDRLVTQLIPLKFASPDEIKTALAPFISKNSVMVSYAPTGTLIITDVLSNIKRLLEIIEKIDVEGTGEIISVTPLEYAGAESMAKSLTSVFKTTAAKSSKDTSGAIIIISDNRTNSIITLASEVDTLKIKELIKILDKETPKGEGDIHVYYLQNANSENLAKVLTSIPTNQTSSGASKEGSKDTAVQISKDVQILADKATNSLIINASKDDYMVLEDIIKKLDIVRKMVYIEALIMEVSMSKDFELGVKWYGGTTTTINGKDALVFGSSNLGASNLPTVDTDTGSVSFASGFSAGVLGDAITIGNLTFPNIAAVVRAYSTNTDVHIVSTPQVTALDNEEATIKVAKNIPYLTSQQQTTAGNDYSNYEFKDVGVTLTITPQINQERFVKLKISQKVDQLVEQEVIGLPTTLTREANTTVVIKDQQTVVIGGLINEAQNNTSYKVPILGDIPILGYLFRSKTEKNDKTNLYIFITPHIIENPAEAKDIYENKMGHINNIQEGAVTMNKGKISQTKDQRLCDLGFSYLQVKDYDKAAEYYQKALTINPDNPFALLNMGIIYENKKEFTSAIDMYEKIISLDPEDRNYNAVDPMQTGQRVTDIAKENLANIEEPTD
jgi:general secretion pathway protein D